MQLWALGFDRIFINMFVKIFAMNVFHVDKIIRSAVLNIDFSKREVDNLKDFFKKQQRCNAACIKIDLNYDTMAPS